MVLTCIMSRTNIATGEVIQTNPPVHFSSNTEDNLHRTDKKDLYGRMVDKIQESLATFQQNCSNWQFTCIVRLEIRTTKYNPLAARGFIPVPEYLRSKRAITNPQNKNGVDCFKWCITRHFHPVKKIRND